ncbi:MAG: hypothetical protein K2W85_17255 [Phycisphaerales bacterium]|nr:hypothetical protein [Phycisphaerales bacterium]
MPALGTSTPPPPTSILERMAFAEDKMRDRLLRLSTCMNAAQISHAIIGDHAVAAWVATIDQSAVRNTQDVDILIRRADFDSTRRALEAVGFIYRKVAAIDMFLDGPAARPRDAVHVVFAQELVRPAEPLPNPDVSESTDLGPFRVINLDALIRIKLTAFRDKDRTHLRDLIGVGLITGSTVATLPAALAARLQSLLDTPDG